MQNVRAFVLAMPAWALAVVMLTLTASGCDSSDGSDGTTDDGDVTVASGDDTLTGDDTTTADPTDVTEAPDTDEGEVVTVAEPITPFSVTATVSGSTVAEVTEAIASYLHEVDDTSTGMVEDWIVAGGTELEEGADIMEAALNLPGGHKIVEVCNHHYAAQAMSFGGHHGVALPCEIAVVAQGDVVDVVILNPEAIFSVFFADVPAEHQDGMAGMAAAVRGELEEIIVTALEGLDASTPFEDVGPAWTDEDLASLQGMDSSIGREIAIPAELLGSYEDKQAFLDVFVDTLLQVTTHEGLEQVGSTVEGLSSPDWRSARTYALSLPTGVKVVELCSPTYATAALSTGTYHGPALPCQLSIYIEGDVVKIDVLDPGFIFPVFFSDAPEEMMADMGTLVTAVQGDILLMVDAAIAATEAL